ncbi:hypothetical protein JGD43_25860, partial [Salmonella enterica subsp. enterica serovar Goldcoast]|nr:hypothetical protein [Salmonella enterica subsp. enterica serovar Goldcoast]
ISDEQLEEIPEEQLVLFSNRVTKAINNARSRRRGGPIRCFECGEPNHIKVNCPKLRGKEARDDKAPAWRSKFKFDSSKKQNYRKAVNKVLSALEEIGLSDIDSDSDNEEDKKKAKEVDFTGMCFMASSEEINDDDDDDLYSDPDEVKPSYVDLSRAVLKLTNELKKYKKKSKKHDLLVDS